MLQLLMFAMYQGTAEEDMWKKDLKRPRMNHVLPQHWNQQEIPAPVVVLEEHEPALKVWGDLQSDKSS